MNDLGKKIRDLREAKELSPEQLAEKVGFAKSAIWAYESGKKQITVSHLSLLADFFDVSVDGLLDRTEKIVDLDLQNASVINDYNLMLDNKPLDQNEIAEAASYIQVKRRMGSYGTAN